MTSPAKTLSWPLLQPYVSFLKLHDNQITQLINLKDQGVLDVSEIEVKITKLLVQMHDTVTKILNDNRII